MSEDYAARIKELLELKAQQLVIMLKAELRDKDEAQAQIEKDLSRATERIKQLEALIVDADDHCYEGYPGIAHDFERMKASHAKAKARIRSLEATLEAVGAEERGEDWYWPYYQHEAQTVMMPTERWILARQGASELLSKYIKGQIKTKNSGQDSKG